MERKVRCHIVVHPLVENLFSPRFLRSLLSAFTTKDVICRFRGNFDLAGKTMLVEKRPLSWK